jgi:hypothetical protein
MDHRKNKGLQIYAAVGAIAGWSAIILQLYLIIINRTVSPVETVARFFSYFTIQTNILVAVLFTIVSSKKNTLDYLSKRASLFTAATVYITTTGIVYNTILRFLWQPEGLQFVVDEALHSSQPLIFVLFWLLFVPKRTLKWRNVYTWMLYPLIYIIYLVIFGALTGFYPYPFADVNQLGYSKVLLNGSMILIAIAFLSLLFIGIAKGLPGKMVSSK